ncbi:hypothetical protein ABZT03_39215 [Streptomyces sp. NPDC005574]|uniref:hypothetical protein n=1 Tax=Streptomyces sp. NPDC005574 TaxID=3156891 RepID=UPI0033ACC6C4
METGGTPRPGAARGFALALALMAGALATGCAGPAGTDTTTARRTAPAPGTRAPSAPAATSPEDLCARIVAHWSREVLDQHTYGDYQSMGLSNGQYEILRDVVDAARAEKRRQGARAADELIDRRTRAGCARWYRDGGPGDGPWQ